MFWPKYFRGDFFVLSLIANMGFIALGGPRSLASEGDYSVNNFGGIGLLDMRTARFAPDGTIAVGAHHNNITTRYFSTWQATPWLETTLSYSDDTDGNSGVDRALDVKLRLLTESDYRPQLAIGIQDALGTGRKSGEYLVASKRYYDVDFTMGLAWGYLGSRGGLGNIFKAFGHNFGHRSTATSSGGLRGGSYFSGQKMSFFAGAEYFTPIRGLSVKLEYSGIDTAKIAELTHLKRKSAFNIGVNYKPMPWADVALGFDQGNRVTIRLTVKQNLSTVKFKRWYKEAKATPIVQRPSRKISAAMLPNIPSSHIKNEKLVDRLRKLGARVMSIEKSEEKNIIKLRINNISEHNDMLYLGALLESYENITLYIYGPEKTEHVKQNHRKYDVTKSSLIGQSARDKYRKTSVYIREMAKSDEDSDVIREMARSAYDKMLAAKLNPVAISVASRRVEVRKNAGPYMSEAKNIGRTARILTREMPDNIEEFIIVSENEGLKTSQVPLLRQDLEKASIYQGSPEEIWVNSKIAMDRKSQNFDGLTQDSITYKPPYTMKFNWGIRPDLLTHFGGNTTGRFRSDLSVKIFGSMQVSQNLKFSAALRQYIVGDIHKIPSDTSRNVPKVRSDIARYAAQGRTALERLEMNYTAQIGQNIYARLSGGLLESMYGGVGAEIVYRPYRQNFAVGVDVNWVKQRNFDQLFSFRNYDVLTGHVTLYHENEAYNIRTKLSAGRYLAGDYGATLDVSRRFSNGIRLGVWASYTNMSYEAFGEGSFDKGIYVTMPLEILWYRPTREKMRFQFRSLGKNGGQMLNKNRNLYDILSIGRKNRLAREWQDILD